MPSIGCKWPNEINCRWSPIHTHQRFNVVSTVFSCFCICIYAYCTCSQSIFKECLIRCIVMASMRFDIFSARAKESVCSIMLPVSVLFCIFVCIVCDAACIYHFILTLHRGQKKMHFLFSMSLRWGRVKKNTHAYIIRYHSNRCMRYSEFLFKQMDKVSFWTRMTHTTHTNTHIYI